MTRPQPQNGDSREQTVASAAHDLSLQSNDDARVDALLREELNEPDHAEYALLTDYFAGELSETDQKQVEERLRTDPEFRALADSLEMLWTLPGSIRRTPTLVERAQAERTWQKLKKRIELAELEIHSPVLEDKRAEQRRRRRRIFAIVAALIGGGLYELFRIQWMPAPVPLLMHTDAPAYEELSTGLPDETQATLLPGAHLSYSYAFSSSLERTLNLDGEATFVVAPGPGALVVHGHGVEVTVAKGRFTVEAYNALPIAHVRVQEGVAQVRALAAAGDGESLTLYAGQSARVGPGQRIKRDDESRAAHPTTNDSAGATTQPGSPPPDAFVRGPRALADRGFALAAAIARDFGQRPRELSFTAKDTIDLVFWNPAFWRKHVPPAEFQQALLPLARKASEQVGAVVWTNYGRDAGINVIRITFIRMRKESSALLTRDVPDEQLVGVLERQPLENGPPKLMRVTMTQR